MSTLRGPAQLADLQGALCVTPYNFTVTSLSITTLPSNQGGDEDKRPEDEDLHTCLPGKQGMKRQNPVELTNLQPFYPRDREVRHPSPTTAITHRIQGDTKTGRGKAAATSPTSAAFQLYI